MRVWDVHPGYLNRQSLLGEHREVHALLVVIGERRAGYARHPETLRWKGHLGALRRRHAVLVAEMTLRGYRHRSPAPHRGPWGRWPSGFLDAPGGQFVLLAEKYRDREPGRIPLPKSLPQLWAQHKYSVMARDPARYRAIGRRVATSRRRSDLGPLALELVELLREPTTKGRLVNAVAHLWGYVSADAERAPELDDPAEALTEIARLAAERDVQYLLHSTALSDLRCVVLRSSSALPGLPAGSRTPAGGRRRGEAR